MNGAPIETYDALDASAQVGDRGANLRTGVAIDAGHDVRRAGGHGDAVGDRQPRHFQRDFQICGAVVDAGPPPDFFALDAAFVKYA